MRRLYTELPKTDLTTTLANAYRDGGNYVIVEDHGLYCDMLVSDNLPAKLKYVKCDNELHKLDS